LASKTAINQDKRCNYNPTKAIIGENRLKKMVIIERKSVFKVKKLIENIIFADYFGSAMEI